MKKIVDTVFILLVIGIFPIVILMPWLSNQAPWIVMVWTVAVIILGVADTYLQDFTHA